MLPDFTIEGLLPPGEHPATLDEIRARFGWNPRRLALLGGLSAALIPLRSAGCHRLYLDGSFVTSKELPGDYDAAWDPLGVNLGFLRQIEPVFFDFTNLRASQKAKYLGEFFPATVPADAAGATFYEFFQIDKNNGGMKGIVVLNP